MIINESYSYFVHTITRKKQGRAHTLRSPKANQGLDLLYSHLQAKVEKSEDGE